MKKGWQTKTLGEVLEKTETVNPLLSPNAEFDYIDVSSVSNTTFQIEETQRLKGKDAPSRARKLVRTNDIIFATIRPTLQRIAVVPEHFDKQVCSTGYFVLRPKPGMDHRFVYYSLFTEDFTGQMESLQKGASYPAVTDGDVRAQEIPVPPLAEQQRIVVLLDEAFEGVATAKANAEKNLQNARALFESHLQSVFTQRGPGWVEKPLGELCDILDNQRKPITKRDRVAGDIPYYGATCIQDYVKDFIFDEPLVLVGEDGAKWKSGDKTAFAVSGKCWVNNHAHVLRPHRDKTTDYWLISFLSHSDLTPFVSGLTVPKLNQGNLREIPIPLPPISIQRQLAETAESLEEETQRLARLYERKHAALEALKKSLLHQAFSGGL